MNIVRLIILFVLVSNLVCLAEMITGPMIQETEIRPGNTERNVVHYATEGKDYVNGGITFSYPSGLFSQVPTVRITIETKMGYSSSELITPCITANSATQTTIRVNKGTVSSFEEAPTGYVRVHLFAVGQ